MYRETGQICALDRIPVRGVDSSPRSSRGLGPSHDLLVLFFDRPSTSHHSPTNSPCRSCSPTSQRSLPMSPSRGAASPVESGPTQPSSLGSASRTWSSASSQRENQRERSLFGGVVGLILILILISNYFVYNLIIYVNYSVKSLKI